MLEQDPETAKEAFHEAAQSFCPSCKRLIRHKEGLEWCQDRQMSEKTLQTRVMARARTRGWRTAHVGKGIAAYDSAGAPIFLTPMPKGWPDLILLKPGEPYPVIAMELKAQRGVVAPEQLEWLELFTACGVPGVIIRPSDLRSGALTGILEGK